MPIFHLKPVVANLENEAWQSSTFRSDCWVNARSEEEARGIASGRFQDGEATIPGHHGRPSPWRDASLVQAIESAPPPGMTIPVNVVVAS